MTLQVTNDSSIPRSTARCRGHGGVRRSCAAWALGAAAAAGVPAHAAGPTVAAKAGQAGEAGAVDAWPAWSLRVAAAALRADTRFRAATAVQLDGTVIDLESSLGVSERKTIPELGLAWRPAARHRIGFAHHQVHRSGAAAAAGEIRVADQVFAAGTALSSRFDTRVTSLDYAYSIWQDGRSEVSLGVGLHHIGLMARIEADSGSPSATERARFVAPTLRLGAAWAPRPRWVLHGYWHELRIDQGAHAGKLRSYGAGVDVRVTPRVSLSVGQRLLLLSLDVDRPDWIGFARSRYRGPSMAMTTAF